MGLEGLRDSYFTSFFAAPYLGLLTNFASCVFAVSLVWRIFIWGLKTLISRLYLINFLITGGFLWLARSVCYSQVNLTSDRWLSDSMWFLCRFRHIRYVESGSYRNLIDSFCQHFHGKHRN